VEVAPVPDGDRHYRVECRHVPAGHDLRVTVSVADRAVVAILGDGAYRDIEALSVEDDGDVEVAAAKASEAVEARNPGAQVDWSAGPFELVPSRLNVAPPPPFAVAWTSGPAVGAASTAATATTAVAD
jgi:hypothetical protein